MDECPLQRYVCTVQTEPRWRFVRSEGALGVLLLLGALGVITMGGAVNTRFEIPRAYVQLPLYALLFLFGLAARRLGLVKFGYTLTDCELVIERIVGRRVRQRVCVALLDIERLVPSGGSQRPAGRFRNFSTWPRGESLLIIPRPGKGMMMRITPGGEFTKELMVQWTNTRI